MKQIKPFLFPLFLIIATLVLSINGIHGSSIGLFDGIGGEQVNSDAVIFGKPRPIRSDEYLVSTPTLISQDINNQQTTNPDIGYGTNFGFHYNLPTDNIFSLFKPATWIFFLTNPESIEFSFSFFWWIRIVLTVISAYLLLMVITKKNILISILGSILIFYSPFMQWWLAIDTLTPIFFGISSFILLVKEKILFKEILLGIFLTYWIISFAIIVYPPFQIPLVWISIFIALGTIISQRKTLDREKLIRLSIILIGSVITVALFLLLFFRMFQDVTDTMMNTTYPGSRFISAGLGNVNHLLNGFFNILMQKDSNGAPYANQSEASNFLILFPFLSPWFIYKGIVDYLKNKRIDWFGVSVVCALVLFSAWYFLPLPDFFSKYTGLYLTLPQRLFIGFGIANYLLIIHMLLNERYHLDRKNIYDIIITILLSIFTGIVYFNVGRYLYNLRPEFFYWPTFLDPTFKILGVAILTPVILSLIISGKRLALYLMVSYTLISTIMINPLYKGLDVLKDTDMAKYMQQINGDNQDLWLVYGDHHYAQYLIANGGHVLNGIHMYPQFELWEILDKDKEYYEIYNRYAHIFLSDYNENDDLVVLKQMDAIEINISPCDSKLEEIGVKYVLSTVDLQDTTCLIHLETFGNANIYERKDITIQP